MSDKYRQQQIKAVQETFPDIEVRECIGSGSFGHVYRGLDNFCNEEVAIKVMDMAGAGEEQRRMFDDEARMLKGLRHPCIVRCRDSSSNGQFCFIVMDYAETNLQDFVRRNPTFFRLRPQLALYVLKQIASGLHHMHSRPAPIGWRDCKPENVLLAQDPQGPAEFKFAALLSDLGTAKRMTQGATMAPGMTPLYLSPENVYSMPFTTASDIWSLGLVFRFMLTAEAPFAVAGLEENIVGRKFQGQLSDLDPPIVDLFEQMTALEPTERPSAQEILAHPLLARIQIGKAGPALAEFTPLPAFVKGLKYGVSEEKVLELGISIGEALLVLCAGGSYALRRVHPDNILVSKHADTCSLQNPEEQDVNVLRGRLDDLAYLPDSVLEGGPCTSASVAWQLGCVLLCLACGRNPFLDAGFRATVNRISSVNPDLSTAGGLADLCGFIVGLMRAQTGLDKFVEALAEARRTGRACVCRSDSLIAAAERGCSKCCAGFAGQAGKLVGDRTALMLAAEKGHLEAVTLLIPREAKMRDSQGKTALVHAIEGNGVDAAKLLLPFEGGIADKDGKTPAEYAKNASLEIRALFPSAAPAAAQPQPGPQQAVPASPKPQPAPAPQACTCDGESKSLIGAAERGCLKCSATFIGEAGKLVNSWTALMKSAAKGHIEVAKLLIPYEAKMKDIWG